MSLSESEWIYKGNSAHTVRYTLGEFGKNMIGCIGINPSTASPGALDSTMQSVKRISAYNGYDGWVMYNIYPQRATDIGDLHDGMSPDLVNRNCREIVKSIKNLGVSTIWIAHGDLIESRPYLTDCLMQIYAKLRSIDLNWKVVGSLTIKGHPRHPLYKPTKSPFVDFEMDEYIEKVVSLKAQQYRES